MAVERRLRIKNVLLDTGSAGTILDADVVSEIGVKPEGSDQTAIIHGVGGTEIVFTKWFDSVILGDWSVNSCKIEIGAMDYGIDVQGILGFDFIQTAKLKKNVQIYDYVDMQVPMLMRMYKKRLKGYHAMGYVEQSLI